MNTNPMKNIIGLKITNDKENHHGFQYQDGLNVLPEDQEKGAGFKMNGSCVDGGFYFTDIANIAEFFLYGTNLRVVELPLSDPDFKCVPDGKNKWRANKIIFGKKYDLKKASTFKFLVANGMPIAYNNFYPVRWAAENGYIDIVKYLHSVGSDICADNNYAIRWAAARGHLEVVKYLVENGADISVNNHFAASIAANYGYTDLVLYLVSCGAPSKYLDQVIKK